MYGQKRDIFASHIIGNHDISQSAIKKSVLNGDRVAGLIVEVSSGSVLKYRSGQVVFDASQPESVLYMLGVDNRQLAIQELFSPSGRIPDFFIGARPP